MKGNGEEMKKRGAVVVFRLSSEEKADWQSRADGSEMTLTDFIRSKVEGAETVDRQPKKRRTSRKADPLLLAGIGRVGSNLNQIARWANTHKSAAEASEIMLALIAIEQHLLSYCPSFAVVVSDVN